MDFNNAPVKRKVQNLLFEGLKFKKVLGLAGPTPSKYLEVLKNYSDEQLLCDIEPVNDSVLGMSLVAAFELNPGIDFVDADFCSSIKSNAVDLYYIFNKLRNKSRAVLTFTLSVRGSSFEETVTTLENIFGITHKQRVIEEMRSWPDMPRKYIHIYKSIDTLDLVTYRDSGENMLSGRIIIQDGAIVEKDSCTVTKKRSYKRRSYEESLQALKEYVDTYHKAPKSTDKGEGGKLYSWIFNNKVSPRRYAEIQQILNTI